MPYSHFLAGIDPVRLLNIKRLIYDGDGRMSLDECRRKQENDWMWKSLVNLVNRMTPIARDQQGFAKLCEEGIPLARPCTIWDGVTP